MIQPRNSEQSHKHRAVRGNTFSPNTVISEAGVFNPLVLFGQWITMSPELERNPRAAERRLKMWLCPRVNCSDLNNWRAPWHGQSNRQSEKTIWRTHSALSSSALLLYAKRGKLHRRTEAQNQIFWHLYHQSRKTGHQTSCRKCNLVHCCCNTPQSFATTLDGYRVFVSLFLHLLFRYLKIHNMKKM